MTRRSIHSRKHEDQMTLRDELDLLRDADERAQRYIEGIGSRPVFPAAESIDALAAFSEPLPEEGHDAASTVALLDEVGSPAAVESNGARYFGFVTGATLPVAAAADRIALAWDNSASDPSGTPGVGAIEQTAADWVLEILDLPRDAAVGFTTSSGSGTVVALATARKTLLARQGWDFDRLGADGAPKVRIVASELAHVVVRKAVRVLGFGLDRVEWVPTDEYGRIRNDQVPALDGSTILILQAGEVNTGEFDDFDALIALAEAVGAWVHVDGAFGLWARATKHKAVTAGIERADSWAVDGHKWLNTPYDSAMLIVRDRQALASTMFAGAVYAPTTDDAQENLTLEFSRRGRGVPVWAALRTLGRSGVASLVEGSMDLASAAADGLRAAGFDVLNRVVLNQVLVAAEDEATTGRIVAAAQASGRTWFGSTVWRGRKAFRISVSSWRTTRAEIDDLVALLSELRAGSTTSE